MISHCVVQVPENHKHCDFAGPVTVTDRKLGACDVVADQPAISGARSYIRHGKSVSDRSDRSMFTINKQRNPIACRPFEDSTVEAVLFKRLRQSLRI